MLINQGNESTAAQEKQGCVKGSQKGHSDLRGPWWPRDILLGHSHTAVHPAAEPRRRVPALSRWAGASLASYALLSFHVLLGRRGLLVLAALRAGFGRRSGAAASGGQEVCRLEHSLRVLPGLHAQRSHAGGAVALAAVGGQEGEAHGVWNTARAQRAPWGGRRQGTITDGEGHGDCLTVPSTVNLERAKMGLESRMATTLSPIDL